MPFSAAESFAMCYQQQFPNSVIAKSVASGPNKMSYVVIYGLRPLIYIYDLYTEHLRQKASKKSTKEEEKENTEAWNRKFEEKKAEKRALDEKLEELKMEEREAHDAVGKPVSCIDEGGKKIHDVLKAGNMMEAEVGNKLIEFGRQKQTEAQGRLEDISKEKDLVQNQLLKKSGCKKAKSLSPCTR